MDTVQTVTKKRNRFLSRIGNLRNPFFLILFIVLVLYTVSLLLPLLWGIITSLKMDADFANNKIGLPKSWMFSNYIKAFQEFKVPIDDATGGTIQMNYFAMLGYTLVYCVTCVTASTIAPCITAYIVSKYKFKFLKVIYYINIVVMILPIVGSLPSEFQLVQALGIYNRIGLAWILKFSFPGMYFLVFYSTFKGLSWGYAEAAFVDGASDFKVMVKIMLPLVRTTIGVVALMMFISLWNDYLIPMLYFSNTPTLALGLYLYRFNGGQGVSTLPLQLAGTFLVILPVLIVFVIFRKQLLGNLTVGGIKG